MSRRRYRYDPDSRSVVEIGDDWTETPRTWGPCTSEGELYDGARTADGFDISSRKKRREYMKLNGLTDPSDFRGAAGSVQSSAWDRAAEGRQKRYTGQVDVSGGKRREQLGRMLYESKGRRP